MPENNTEHNSGVSLVRLNYRDEIQVERSYKLIVDAIGNEGVEDFASFLGTISPETDSAIVPIALCAVESDDLIGVTIGAYLKNLKAGFVAYSGVRHDWRRRGVYTYLHESLVQHLASASMQGGYPNGIGYVASELDNDNWLIETYRNKWSAEVLSCSYEQPETQGLTRKPLSLVVQPVAKRALLSGKEAIALVGEIYRGVYRVNDVASNESYLRVLASVSEPSHA